MVERSELGGGPVASADDAMDTTLPDRYASTVDSHVASGTLKSTLEHFRK
jgi:hypothetical protein